MALVVVAGSYAQPAATNTDRLRLLIGDHRGDLVTASGWVFSNNELEDILTLTGNLMHAARICLQIRINREAMGAGVAGTTDTSDRPSALINAIRQLERLDYPGAKTMPVTAVHAKEDLDAYGEV